MAMVKIAILLLIVNVFTATALENFHEIGVDSIHELHPYPSEAPSPSKDAGEHHKAAIVCAMGCVAKCQEKQPWKQVFCIGVCLAQCATGPSDSVPQIACALECAQSSTNNLRDEAKMDNRISACTERCKNN